MGIKRDNVFKMLSLGYSRCSVNVRPYHYHLFFSFIQLYTKLSLIRNCFRSSFGLGQGNPRIRQSGCTESSQPIRGDGQKKAIWYWGYYDRRQCQAHWGIKRECYKDEEGASWRRWYLMQGLKQVCTQGVQGKSNKRAQTLVRRSEKNGVNRSRERISQREQ